MDEVRDDNTGVILSPGTKLRSQEIAEALVGKYKLSPAEVTRVKARWEVDLE